MSASSPTYLNCCQCRNDGRRTETVWDQRKVRQMSLYRGIEYVLGSGIAERRSILVQQVHQLLRDLWCGRERCISTTTSFCEVFRHLSKLTCLVLSSSSFLRYDSCGSEYWRDRYSATCRAGNSVSHTYPKSRARWMASPSTSDVSRVTFAALRRPAGRFRPIFSNFSLSNRPPFLLFAL